MFKNVLFKRVLVGAMAAMLLGVTGAPSLAAASGSLTMSGSTSVYPLAQALKTAYNNLHPGAIGNIAEGGSGVGIADVLAGRVDIGNVSRDLKASEIAQGLVATTIARDAIAIIVNPANTTVSNLTKEEVAAIFAGEVTNWSEFGGPNAAIVVDSRTAPSGTLDYFKEFFGVSNIVADGAHQFASNEDLRAAVAGNQYAIGFLSMGEVNSSIKALSLDGHAPAETASYPCIRNFNMVTNGAPVGNVLTFLTWVTTDTAGKNVVTANGYLLPNTSSKAAVQSHAARITTRTQRATR